jgi:hypothetical protein
MREGAVGFGKPRRIGAARLPSHFGLGINISWAGVGYSDYSFTERYRYVDIRSVFLIWMIWVQIPVRRYGIRGVA